MDMMNRPLVPLLRGYAQDAKGAKNKMIFPLTLRGRQKKRSLRWRTLRPLIGVSCTQ